MSQGPRQTDSTRAEQAARTERLARALRDNLRRRKEQAREREGEPGGGERPGAPAPEPGKPPA